MFRLFVNNVDKTEFLVKNSVSLSEQLNNRSNTCSFGMIREKAEQSSIITIYEVMELTRDALSGQAILNVDDTYVYYDNFRPGDEVIVDIEGPNQQFGTILSIDDTLKEVTLTSNLPATISKGSFVGRVVFSGSVQNNPDGQMGYLNEFEYQISCVDYTVTFNRQVVVETYVSQYMREIVGRIVYEFCATDLQEDLDMFESPRTQGGVARPMQNNSTDRIQGNFSQETGTTGAGVATRTKTLGSPVDITGLTDMRIWHKVKEAFGSTVTTMKFRIGNDSSNYYEWSSDRVGVNNEDCWNYDNYKLSRAAVTGTVNDTLIDYLYIEVTATGAIPQDGLLFDGMEATLGGFTLKNTMRGIAPFEDFRKQYEKPSTVLENMAKLQGLFWYIDYDRDIHVFQSQTNQAPFSINNTDLNRGDMTVSADINMLRNRQTVRGGEAPAQTLYTQDSRNDGLLESWPLDYKPKDISIYVAYQDKVVSNASRLAGVATITVTAHGYSNGNDIALTDIFPNQYNGSFVISNATTNTFDVAIADDPGTFVSSGFAGIFQQKTIGTENLTDPLTVDYLFNFNEKIVKRSQDSILPDGSVFRRVYYPYQAIRVRLKDQASIDAMKLIGGGDGIFDGPVIEDSSILSFQEARRRARAELDAYSNPIIKIKFITNQAGLHAGQIINITDTNRGISDDYLIQKVSRKSKEGARGIYTVECASTMFGLIEFFQLLLKKTRKFTADVSELVDIVVNDDETITITPVFTFTQKATAVTAASSMTNKWFDFIECNGSRTTTGRIFNSNRHKNNMWRAEVTAATTASVGFNVASGYNDLHSLFCSVTSYTGSPTGKYARARLNSRLRISPSVLYNFAVRVQNAVSTGLVGGLGYSIYIQQFANQSGGSVLATTPLITNSLALHGYKYYTTSFTSNASANYIDIIIEINESIGRIDVGDIRIQETTAETQSNPGIASFSETT